jgi:hypothetical protein
MREARGCWTVAWLVVWHYCTWAPGHLAPGTWRLAPFLLCTPRAESIQRAQNAMSGSLDTVTTHSLSAAVEPQAGKKAAPPKVDYVREKLRIDGVGRKRAARASAHVPLAMARYMYSRENVIACVPEAIRKIFPFDTEGSPGFQGGRPDFRVL